MEGEQLSKSELRQSPGDLNKGASEVEESQVEGRPAAKELERHTSQYNQTQRIESLGTLSGGLAHEFKNILQSILINAELATDIIPAESPEHEYLSQIIEAAKRGRNLVRQINTFSLRNNTHSEPIAAYPVVQDALHVFRSALSKDITFRQWLKDRKARIQVDSVQLAQLVTHLCANAQQAITTGRGFVGVSLKQTLITETIPAMVKDLKPGKYIQLTVKDTGCGISSETMGRIFDPFFTTKQSRDRSGLGLSVVYAVVKSGQGSIIVESTPGKGTSFKVFFPVLPEEAVPHSIASTTTGIKEERRCVLLVDDDMADLSNIQELLVHLGYSVRSTHDPQEALRIFKHEPNAFALVISDQVMPRMRGHELAVAIHAIREDIPVIICSGTQEPLEELRVSHSGIKAFMRKPLSEDRLSQTLDNALN